MFTLRLDRPVSHVGAAAPFRRPLSHFDRRRVHSLTSTSSDDPPSSADMMKTTTIHLSDKLREQSWLAQQSIRDRKAFIFQCRHLKCSRPNGRDVLERTWSGKDLPRVLSILSTGISSENRPLSVQLVKLRGQKKPILRLSFPVSPTGLSAAQEIINQAAKPEWRLPPQSALPAVFSQPTAPQRLQISPRSEQQEAGGASVPFSPPSTLNTETSLPSSDSASTSSSSPPSPLPSFPSAALGASTKLHSQFQFIDRPSVRRDLKMLGITRTVGRDGLQRTWYQTYVSLVLSILQDLDTKHRPSSVKLYGRNIIRLLFPASHKGVKSAWKINDRLAVLDSNSSFNTRVRRPSLALPAASPVPSSSLSMSSSPPRVYYGASHRCQQATVNAASASALYSSPSRPSFPSTNPSPFSSPVAPRTRPSSNELSELLDDLFGPSSPSPAAAVACRNRKPLSRPTKRKQPLHPFASLPPQSRRGGPL